MNDCVYKKKKLDFYYQVMQNLNELVSRAIRLNNAKVE